MAAYTSGANLGITKQQLLVVRLMTEGQPIEEVARAVFDVTNGTDEDPAKLKKACTTIRKWLREDKIKNAYNEMLREFMIPELARAARKLAEQIDDKNGWLSNKAANDILTRYGDFNKNSNELVVRVEGAPTLGTPEE